MRAGRRSANWRRGGYVRVHNGPAEGDGALGLAETLLRARARVRACSGASAKVA